MKWRVDDYDSRVNGQSVQYRVLLIRHVNLGHLLAGLDIQAHMKTGRNVLAGSYCLELARGFEDARVAFCRVVEWANGIRRVRCGGQACGRSRSYGGGKECQVCQRDK